MPETSTFLLCGKKYMISMEDVASLTGLCIGGDAIVWKEENNVSALCKKVLGKEPPEAAGGAVNYSWLLATFGTLENEATTEQIIFSARAYILFILGTVVLPNNTGAKVDAVYLTFLQNDEDFQDFEHIRNYSWGSAMLALLIDNLKKEPSKNGVVNLAGSAALLEFWAYMRFPLFRPVEISIENGSVPLMVQWSKDIAKRSRNTHRPSSLNEWITVLDSSQDIEFSRISNVEFQSDLSFLKNQLPLTLSVTAVFHGSTYAHYRPDCCFQQFDGVPACTSTPQLPSAFKVLNRKIRQRKGPQYHTDWNEEVPIKLWANRHETIIGMLRYGDDGPENDEETPGNEVEHPRMEESPNQHENDEETPENEVESPRMEESPNQPENEEERESEMIEGERNEEERESQQVARLHKRARKQMPEGIIPRRSTRLQNKARSS